MISTDVALVFAITRVILNNVVYRHTPESIITDTDLHSDHVFSNLKLYCTE